MLEALATLLVFQAIGEVLSLLTNSLNSGY
jgi:hypothetical protein